MFDEINRLSDPSRNSSDISITIKDSDGKSVKNVDANFSVDSDERGEKVITLRNSSGRRVNILVWTGKRLDVCFHSDAQFYVKRV